MNFSYAIEQNLDTSNVNVKKDVEQAIKWIQNVAQQGHPEAQYILGMLYYEGTGVPQDHCKAAYWFKQKNHSLQNNTDNCEEISTKVVSDNFFNELSALGTLDRVYNKALDVVLDPKYAQWIIKVTHQSLADAQYYLNWAYKNGTPSQIKQAVKWYNKTALQWQVITERKFKQLKITSREQIEAFQEYKHARQNDPKAQLNLGVMFEEGYTVPQNYNLAVLWYTKAAYNELPEAQYNIGRMYHTGKGVPQDYNQAVKWYKKAAFQNHPEAQYNLGLMYANGEGVILDNYEAYAWLQIAIYNGVQKAKIANEKLLSQILITDEQLALAQLYAVEIATQL